MDNKGQIGKLLTWMPALVIIFFLITLFLIGATFLSVDKFGTEGGDNIGLTKFNVDTRSQEALFDILDSKMEGGLTVKEFIKDNYEDQTSIRKPIDDLIKDKYKILGKCGYLFQTEYNVDNLEEYYIGGIDEKYLPYKRIIYGSIVSDKINQQEGVSFYLGDARIRTKFYLGECKNE